MKRILALAIAIVMVMALVPSLAFAEGENVTVDAATNTVTINSTSATAEEIAAAWVDLAEGAEATLVLAFTGRLNQIIDVPAKLSKITFVAAETFAPILGKDIYCNGVNCDINEGVTLYYWACSLFGGGLTPVHQPGETQTINVWGDVTNVYGGGSGSAGTYTGNVCINYYQVQRAEEYQGWLCGGGYSDAAFFGNIELNFRGDFTDCSSLSSARICGGGNMAPVTGDIEVNIEGIVGNYTAINGGGYANYNEHDLNRAKVTGNIVLNFNDGAVSTDSEMMGGGYKANVEGDITVTVNEGARLGRALFGACESAVLYGNSTVIFNGGEFIVPYMEYTGLSSDDGIYAGANEGVSANGVSKLIINGGYIDGHVHGGGYSFANYNQTFDFNDTEVIINGGTIEYGVWALGHQNSVTDVTIQNAVVTVNNGSGIKQGVYAGGRSEQEQVEQSTININDRSFSANKVHACGMFYDYYDGGNVREVTSCFTNPVIVNFPLQEDAAVQTAIEQAVETVAEITTETAQDNTEVINNAVNNVVSQDNAKLAAVEENVEKLAKLEELYVAANEIEVTVVDSANTGASVSGAGLSVDHNAESKVVEVIIAEAAIPADDTIDAIISEGETVVPLSVTMKVGGAEAQPKAPVTITIPAPAGLDLTKTVKILHVHGTKTELIVPKIVGRNLEFTLTNFSEIYIYSVNEDRTGESLVKMGVDPSYVVVIPSTVEFGTLSYDESAIANTTGFYVTVQQAFIAKTATITVTAASDYTMENNGEPISYKLFKNALSATEYDETAVLVDGTNNVFATFGYGEGVTPINTETFDATVWGYLSCARNQIKYAGSYSDVMTFTITYNP